MDVLANALWVVEHSDHVRLDRDAIDEWADRHADESFDVPSHPPELIFRGQRDELANFVLLQDCLNFCFWSTDGKDWQADFADRTWRRYYALVACLLRAVAAEPGWLRPDRWLSASLQELRQIFRGRGQIPMLEKRLQVLRETARILVERYDGQFASLIADVGGNAPAIARRLAQDFPSFYDVATYRGRKVAFLKRAQICAADLATTFEANGVGTIDAVDRLTAFADYRLPQVLRHKEIVRLSEALAERIDAGLELPAGSDEEIELRANTIWAVREMQRALASRGHEWSAYQIDNYLWHQAHDSSVTVPHHRTRTIFY